jgi:CheY-like chemotaxis protein
MSKEKETKHERHVLIVDDNPDYLAMAGDSFRALSEGHWHIHTATSTVAALEILKTSKIELVVWDVNAPAPDGAWFLDSLKRGHHKLKKAVMASAATDEKLTASLAGHADLILEKPVSPEGLKSVFAKLCGLSGWAAPHGFQGVLRSVGLADLVQMECLARNSSILELYREQSLGRIYIEDGQIIHAVCGEISGEGAFYKLLALNGGAFELHEFTLPPDRTINRTWEFLLAGAKSRRESLDLRTKTGTAASIGTETFSGQSAGQASEMLICSGTGEVLYNWQCHTPDGRVTLMQNIAQRAEQMIPELQLGKLDRLEIQLAGSRAVLQPRADRLVFLRAAVNHAGHEG